LNKTPKGTELATPTVGAAADDDRLLTEAEFCELWSVAPRTLQRWRKLGGGPPYVRLGPKQIRYRLETSRQWAASRTFAHHAAELAASAKGRE
jgi:predicted DNA-binding transcriptional regulator AlpA